VHGTLHCRNLFLEKKIMVVTVAATPGDYATVVQATEPTAKEVKRWNVVPVSHHCVGSVWQVAAATLTPPLYVARLLKRAETTGNVKTLSI
jgi:hypothetical protein